MIPKLIAAVVVMVAMQRTGGTPVGLPQGPVPVGAPTVGMQTQTTFEKLVSKLNLDKKTQLPEVQRILMSAAVDAESVGREMIRLRLRMLEDARSSVDLAPLVAEYATQAGKMANIEAKAFGDIRLLLNKGQASRSTEAFVLMAGIFQPPTPRSGGRRGGGSPPPEVLMSTGASPIPQRGGGTETIIQGARGGGGQRIGGARGPVTIVDRETVLHSILFLNKDQKKQFKNIMDAAHKAAAPTRDELTKTRAVMSSLIDQDAPPDSISQAADAYGVPAAAMTAAEMNALAKVLGLLTPEQQPNTNTVQAAASLMRGSFLGKNWNARVDERFY